MQDHIWTCCVGRTPGEGTVGKTDAMEPPYTPRIKTSSPLGAGREEKVKDKPATTRTLQGRCRTPSPSALEKQPRGGGLEQDEAAEAVRLELSDSSFIFHLTGEAAPSPLGWQYQGLEAAADCVGQQQAVVTTRFASSHGAQGAHHPGGFGFWMEGCVMKSLCSPLSLCLGRNQRGPRDLRGGVLRAPCG